MLVNNPLNYLNKLCRRSTGGVIKTVPPVYNLLMKTIYPDPQYPGKSSAEKV